MVDYVRTQQQKRAESKRVGGVRPADEIEDPLG